MSWLLIKSFHIIAMVAWFAGLFYLPRLFVYHAQTFDLISIDRFKVMERRLYYAITWPAAIITTALGFWLISANYGYYFNAKWMHAKLFFVGCLWIYHFFCGIIVQQFKMNKNRRSAKFYRIFNEIPTILLIAIVLLVIIKPF